MDDSGEEENDGAVEEEDDSEGDGVDGVDEEEERIGDGMRDEALDDASEDSD